MNPYDWQRHRPQVEISRDEIDPLVEKLCRGKSGVLLAGRGMGCCARLAKETVALFG
jgi:galactokinase